MSCGEASDLMFNFENRMSNSLPKKTFSSANFTLLICSTSLIVTYWLRVVKPILSDINFAAVGLICFGIILISLGFALYIKCPLFIEPNPVKKPSEDFYDKKYTQDLGWLRCLYFSVFTAERSEFISFFSGATITIYGKGRVCNFTWENKPIKPIHRLLDFLLILLLAPLVIFLVWEYTNLGLATGISTCVIGIMFLFRKRILFNILSINVGKARKYKLNVIYPYSTSRLHRYKYYGVAEPFTKTILITEDTFRLNPIIKEYVTAHEVGHLNDKKILFTHCLFPITIMIYLSILPYLFSGLAAFIPLVTYLVYKRTIGYRIDESAEFFADSFAVKIIGKEKCIEALTLMNKTSKSNGGNDFFKKAIPLEKRIQFIKAYKEDNNR